MHFTVVMSCVFLLQFMSSLGLMRQPIVWTNADLLPVGPLGTNLISIFLIKMQIYNNKERHTMHTIVSWPNHIYYFDKMCLKMCTKYWPFPSYRLRTIIIYGCLISKWVARLDYMPVYHDITRIMAAGRHAPLQSLGGLRDNMAQFSLRPSLAATQLRTSFEDDFPDNKVHGVNMGPTWVLAAPDGPHIGPMNLAIRAAWWFERERDTRPNHQVGHFQIWLISG